MRFKVSIFLTLSVLVLSALISGCGTSLFSSKPVEYQKAEVLFEATSPSALQEGQKLQIEFLDDVTGLAFNPQRFDMIQKDERTFYYKTTLTLHSNVKYRYIKGGQNVTVELNPGGEQIRFRLLSINDPITVSDSIAAWPEEPFSGETGTIAGQFYDKANNTPLPNLLVTAQGIQAITASDGSFRLQGVNAGTHLITVMALDGSYNDFQQQAVVAGNAITPVYVGLEKRPLVNVTFEAILPEGLAPSTELRIASNMYSLGNLYSDVYAGSTLLSADLPVMQKLANGTYSLTLALPAGAYFNYKYSLGDGFWNGELNSGSTFEVREFIVPDSNTTQKDTISAFQAPNSGLVTFNVTVPASTPVEDIVTIQFNPFDWLAPIPMTRVDATHWTFVLYNPQGYFGQTSFRFCRNNVCDLTHEIEPQGNGQSRVLIPGADPQTIQATVDNWQLLYPSINPTTVTTEPQGSSPRTDFITGFEVDPSFAPLLRSTQATLFSSISAMGANWAVLQPTWTATSINPPYLDPIPGKDLLWPDLLTQVETVRKAGLSVALFPRVDFPNGVTLYWQSSDKDPAWWQHWFDGYHRFILESADAANLSGAAAIILGDPGVKASFSGGTLSDGSSSNSPSTSDDQWRQLVTDIRARYSGPVIGAVEISEGSTELPAWFDSVDAIYMIVHPVVSADSASDFRLTFEEVDAFFENSIKPVSEGAGKPILIGLSVPSTTDAYLGCGASGVNCDEDTSAVGNADNLDLDLQARITNAAIMSASSKSYINGFFSRGYQAAGSLQDASDSVHGKPANDVLWYWYHFLGGKAQ